MPVKFVDIPKEAASILNDDYVVSGYVFKTKQKTSWAGAVLSSQVDLFASDKCATPAKLAWKLPSPFGCKFFDIDKLEMDKGGSVKLEASSEKAHSDVKIECKADLADFSKLTVCSTYTGMKDAQVKFECKATNPLDFVCEATYAMGKATCGVKFSAKAGLPDFGIRFLSGPMFCSLLCKDKLGTVSAAGLYKANSDLNCAATYDHSLAKGNGKLTMGVVYQGLYKVKISQDQTVCCSAKHSIAKGFSLLFGAKYGIADGNVSYGCQVSIE
mmetsp:Transcript_11574/g.31106  ORF Transcript_11574/g.31106 Transcript_11574/m.31106 type:complete len:271 (+) Transcript_11574:93-905(+)